MRACVRACAVACARARLRARLPACARAWFRARVHGGVRVNVPACVCMCVPARVRPSRFTKLYINAAWHILFLPHTHCSFYRTTRQNYIFSVRACAVASVLRAYTVACAIAWFCARVHWLRVCVRLSKFCVRTHGTVPTFIIEQIAVALCNIFYFLFQPSTVTYSLYGTFLYTMLLLRTPCIVLSLCKTFS